MRKSLTAIAILVFLLNLEAQTPSELAAISKKDLLKNVEILTSREFDGRLPVVRDIIKPQTLLQKNLPR